MMHITKQLQQLLLVMLVMLPVGRLGKSGKAELRHNGLFVQSDFYQDRIV